MSTDAPNANDRTLYEQTSRLAGEAAARSIASRRAKILSYLAERGPDEGGTLFEIAEHYGYFDHQISGRFTELQKDGLIVRTGKTRTNPKTGCVADVWALRREVDGEPPLRAKDLGDALGYPVSLQIPKEGLFHREPMLKAHEGTPGIPYLLDARAAGLRLAFRVELIECGGCGRPLKLCPGGEGEKIFRCGTAGCNRTWHLLLVHEPGGADMPALVLKGS